MESIKANEITNNNKIQRGERGRKNAKESGCSLPTISLPTSHSTFITSS